MVKFGSFGFVQNENLFAGSKDLDGSKDLELTCPICLEIFDRPVTTQCGHTYCQSCLQECLCRPDPVCAMCRTDLQGNWAKATELEDLIRSSVAPCKGCTAKVRLTHMKSHTATCAKYQECIEEEIKATAQSRQAVIKPVPNRHTFTCPYCDFRNLDQDGLAEHCTSQHARDPHPVVCPICASMPWGDPEYRSGNFLRHLKTRHTFAYDTYVDYSADEEVMMREALERSLTQQ